MDYDREDTRKYKVVKSVKGYVAIWLSHKEIPKGWSEVGFEGLKDECLRYIKEKFMENPDMAVYKKFYNLK